MNIEVFESYLKKDKVMTDHEAREVISRISWVETTLNISLDKMLSDGEDLTDMEATLIDVVGSEEKAALFYDAVCLYLACLKIYCQ